MNAKDRRSHDDWERLVAAVLKRDQIRQLCHAPSISSVSSSISSCSSSPASSSRFDQPDLIQEQWCDEYSPDGVHITLAPSPDGTHEVVKRVQFSPKMFNESEAQTWWVNNMNKVYDMYGSPARLIQLNTASGRAKPAINLNIIKEESISCEWFQPYAPGVFVQITALKDKSRQVKQMRFSQRRFNNQEAEAWWLINGDRVVARFRRPPPSGINLRLMRKLEPILILDFNEILSSANGDGPTGDEEGMHGWTIMRYKQGVYVTLVGKENEGLEVESVRFSKNNFEAHEAVEWWDKNQEEVYKTYGVNYNRSEEDSKEEEEEEDSNGLTEAEEPLQFNIQFPFPCFS